MLPEEIARARELINNASDGPWRATTLDVEDGYSERAGIYRETLPVLLTTCGVAVADADFIAAARTGWPRALDALEAVTRERERLRASLVDANVEVERLRRDKVEITVSRGIDPKDPEGVTLRIEGSREAWDFHVTDFTRYTTPPKWDVSRRAESAEAQVAALRERVADLEGQIAMRGTP